MTFLKSALMISGISPECAAMNRCLSGEVLEQTAQKGCGSSVPGGTQKQVGWGPKKSDLVLDLVAGNSAWGRGNETWQFLRSLPT